jgi:NAD(P)-dependent dehydrogenase (short-subunit alcohol dehydrogenase family)
MEDLTGRVALVTGASRGIGASIATAFADAGADVAVTYREQRDSAELVAREVERRGRRALIARMAVEDEAEVRAVVKTVCDALGPIDILVNNAGILTPPAAVVDTSPEDVEQVWRVHVLGAFHVTRAVIPVMRSHGSGAIVMISSIGAALMPPRHAPYVMAKHALEALAHTVAKEERDHGIRVNIVAPGVTSSGMTHQILAWSGRDVSALDATAPFGRLCRAEEVAAVVRFVVADENRYVNDQRITVDGGTF